MHRGKKGQCDLLVTGVVVSTFACAAVVGAGPAVADSTYPSQEDVEEAREAEREAGSAVAAAEARLSALQAELDQVRIDAGKAVEAHNGARIALAEAEGAEERARNRARETAAEAADARDVLSQVVAASYREGGGLAHVGLILNAEDSRELYDAAATFRSLTESQAGAFRRAAEATEAAEDAADEARAAVGERERAARHAEDAYREAHKLVAEQESAAAAAEAERQELLGVLAAARGTTVALEEDRQRALAEETAEDEREEPDLPDEPTGRPTGEPTSSANPTTAPPDPTRSPTHTRTSPPDVSDTEPPDQPDDPEPPDQSEPPDDPEPPDPPKDPDPSEPPDEPDPPEGAAAAVAYTHDQLGKPYEWGADGPDAFDCSGLTMRAWEAGGKSLPHWSGAQAEQVTRISYGQMRPGDLVFWSDNGQASGVYHVGLYIGDGKMIHAPRSGKDVEIQSVFYWLDPAFYGRVV